MGKKNKSGDLHNLRQFLFKKKKEKLDIAFHRSLGKGQLAVLKAKRIKLECNIK